MSNFIPCALIYVRHQGRINKYYIQVTNLSLNLVGFANSHKEFSISGILLNEERDIEIKEETIDAEFVDGPKLLESKKELEGVENA